MMRRCMLGVVMLGVLVGCQAPTSSSAPLPSAQLPETSAVAALPVYSTPLPVPVQASPTVARLELPGVPDYPQVVSTPVVTERSVGIADPWFPRRRITFLTIDPPNQVRTFYEEQLTRQGWGHLQQYLEKHIVRLHNLGACPQLYIDIFANKLESTRHAGKTLVRIDLVPVDCGSPEMEIY
jgi:hypothetical protein